MKLMDLILIELVATGCISPNPYRRLTLRCSAPASLKYYSDTAMGSLRVFEPLQDWHLVAITLIPFFPLTPIMNLSLPHSTSSGPVPPVNSKSNCEASIAIVRYSSAHARLDIRSAGHLIAYSSCKELVERILTAFPNTSSSRAKTARSVSPAVFDHSHPLPATGRV
jgi:hypothetical protein